MSIRSTIEKFEALSRDEDSIASGSETKLKRFRYPGNRNSEPGNFVTRSPRKNSYHMQSYEADLQEVWSVRKNVHHTGGIKNAPGIGSLIKPGLYSRHGAMPTGISSEDDAAGPKRTPLQDFNSMESPWNMKKGGYSYGTSVENMAKRPIDSPKPAGVESSILPAAKRMINAAMEGKGTSFPLKTSTDRNDKVKYAKRMAQGYLKSVGMGEYTPNTDPYTKQSRSSSLVNGETSAAITSPTRWKKLDLDNEFDFDV